MMMLLVMMFDSNNDGDDDDDYVVEDDDVDHVCVCVVWVSLRFVCGECVLCFVGVTVSWVRVCTVCAIVCDGVCESVCVCM